MKAEARDTLLYFRFEALWRHLSGSTFLMKQRSFTLLSFGIKKKPANHEKLLG